MHKHVNHYLCVARSLENQYTPAFQPATETDQSNSLKTRTCNFVVTTCLNLPCFFTVQAVITIYMSGCYVRDWSVNREACLWQSYLPCSVLLGVRQAGIKARGKRRPVTGTKEFQGPGWKWIPIRVAAPASLPLSLLALPPLAPAGQPPSPWCFVVLLWLFKSLL